MALSRLRPWMLVAGLVVAVAAATGVAALTAGGTGPAGQAEAEIPTPNANARPQTPPPPSPTANPLDVKPPTLSPAQAPPKPTSPPVSKVSPTPEKEPVSICETPGRDYAGGQTVTLGKFTVALPQGGDYRISVGVGDGGGFVRVCFRQGNSAVLLSSADGREIERTINSPAAAAVLDAIRTSAKVNP